MRFVSQLPGRSASSVCPLPRHRRESIGSLRGIHRSANDETSGIMISRSIATSRPSSTPFGNAVHTALSFPILGEDVLITGAGPIGCMAAAVVRHAGARFVVVTDVNPWRLELARKMGATRVVDVRNESLTEVQNELGMTEGFDVGLEMSGNSSAFSDMLSNMAHGGKIAMLGIPPDKMAIDWDFVVFNMLTIKRHLRSRDVRNVVSDDRATAERLGHQPRRPRIACTTLSSKKVSM